MRAVIDTNVSLSGLLWHGAPHALIEQVRAGTLAMVSSPALLAELAEVVSRAKFAEILARSNTLRESVPAEVRQLAEVIVSLPLSRPMCRDPDDDHVLACALAAQADLIVSGHADLLNLREYQSIRIVAAAEALPMAQDSPDCISVIGPQLYQPIADLIGKLLARPYQQPDRISSNHFEGGYAAAIVVLLAATVESLVQRDRYFYTRAAPTTRPSAKVPEYMKLVHGYRRHAHLDELFEVRNTVAHNHLWEIRFATPAAGGRRHKGSSVVPNTHRLRAPPVVGARVPRTKRLRINLQPTRLDRTDVAKALAASLHLLQFLSAKGYGPVPLTAHRVSLCGKLLSFSDLLREFTSVPLSHHSIRTCRGKLMKAA